jgi:hypothetical protein
MWGVSTRSGAGRRNRVTDRTGGVKGCHSLELTVSESLYVAVCTVTGQFGNFLLYQQSAIYVLCSE